MIGGIFHHGSGLGDQLMRYITVRTLAVEKGWNFGMCNEAAFKGSVFMQIDTGIPIGSPEAMMYSDKSLKGFKKWEEKDIRDENGLDIRSYDPEINFVEDNTIIDGSFEDARYFEHNLKNIDTWLKVEPLEMQENTCVISHRGGEYKIFPELYLPDGYWHHAVLRMLKINSEMEFIVQSDDTEEAKRIFPDFKVIDNQQIAHSKHTAMGLNWRHIRYAPYLIVGNSAFSILPSLLGPAKVILAPRYHAGHNVGVWKRPACYYKRYQYISPTDYHNEIYTTSKRL